MLACRDASIILLMERKHMTPKQIIRQDHEDADRAEEDKKAVEQAIKNSEVLWEEMLKMQADIELLKRRVSVLEECD
ncbi:MAG: hypothetical protein ACYCO5_05280 [Acidobacteriaceae bacterium]